MAEGSTPSSKASERDKKLEAKSVPSKADWKARIKWDSPERSRSRSRSRGSSSDSHGRNRRRRSKRAKSRSARRSRSRKRSPVHQTAPSSQRRSSKWDEQSAPAAESQLAIPKAPAVGLTPMKPHVMMALSQPGTRMVRIPQIMVGRIVGRGGAAIKQFKQMSGCEMGLERDAEGQFLLIRGPTPEMASNAEALINERLLADAMKLPDDDKVKLFSYASTSAHALAEAAMSATTRVFNIGTELVPKVLGVGGNTVYNIQKTAGCTVKIDPDGQVNLSRGTPAQMDNAQRLILAAVENAKNIAAPKGSGKSMSGMSAPPMENPSILVNPMPWVGSQIV